MEIASEAIARTLVSDDPPEEKIGDNRENIPFCKLCSYDRERAERSTSNQLRHRTLQRLWKGEYLHK